MLKGDRLYTQVDDILYVYSMSDLTSPIATYEFPGDCCSGLIADNLLFFLGGFDYINIIVYQISTSLKQPLRQLAAIETHEWTNKIIKLGKELVLGEWDGYIQVFDIKNYTITHTQQFREIGNIKDMIAIEDSGQLLLAGDNGLLKATKDIAIKHYFQGKKAVSICHIADSLYLVGFFHEGLIVWNEQSDQELFQICQNLVFSIKRILNTNNLSIKTEIVSIEG